MKVDDCIYGVLNFDQLKFFCEKFNLEVSEIKSNFEGWRKLILYTHDRVFIFPRDPRGVEWLEREILAYDMMDSIDYLPVPKLIEKVSDSNISFYEFAVVTRRDGVPYSKLESDVSFDDLAKLLSNLAKVLVSLHEIPLENLPEEITQKKVLDETKYSWEIHALDPATMMVAFDYVHEMLLKYCDKFSRNQFEILKSDKTRSLWIDCLNEVVSLPHVFLHGDIHEDQILVESKRTMEITGILDWETVRIGNPVWDFNFFEWGFGIWGWWEYFSEFRRLMWKIYLEGRRIQLQFSGGLDLFYTFSEFLIVLQSEKNLGRLIGENPKESIRMCLEKLVRITGEMESSRLKKVS